MAMSKKNLADSVKGYTADVQTLVNLLASAETHVKNISEHSAKAAAAMSGATNKAGSRNNGKSSKVTLGTDDARFSNEAIYDRLNGSIMPWLDRMEASANKNAMAQMRYNNISTGINTAIGVGQGLFGMMPNVNATIQRATSFYNAGIMSGYSGSRGMMERSVFNAMGGGLTSGGADAQVAQALAMQGMNFSTNKSSTFMQTATAVGNAAKYLNMDNNSAAAAIAGLTSGATSKTLMQRLGVFTSDPRTGKELTQGQIFQQVASRLTNGQKLTVQGVNDSFRRGFLGQDLNALGFSADQQQLFKQYLIEKAKGNNMDLSNQKGMDALMKKAGISGNTNPENAAMRINASNTQAMQTAESAYIAGLNAAATAIEGLNNAIGLLTPTLGGFKSFFEGFGGSPAGAGATSIFGSLANGAMSIGGNYMMMKGLMGGKGGAGGGGGVVARGSRSSKVAGRKGGGKVVPAGGAKAGGWKLGAGGKAGFKMGMKGGLIASGIGALMDLPGDIQATSEGRGGSAFGGTIGSVAGGAIGSAIGMAIPIPGVDIAAAFLLGGIGSSIGGSLGSAIGGNFDAVKNGSGWGAFATGGNTWAKRNGTGGAKATNRVTAAQAASVKFHDPTNSRQLNSGGGYAAGVHDGWDYQASYPPGRPVFAVYDGTVIESVDSDGGEGNHIHIDHGDVNGKNVFSLYMHLSTRMAQHGAKVKAGQQIGVSGASGSGITGPHLHVSIAEGSINNRVNPGKYLTATGGGGNYANSGQTVPDASGGGASVASSGGTTNVQGASYKGNSGHVGTLSAMMFRNDIGYADVPGSQTTGASLTGAGTKNSTATSYQQALSAAGFKGAAYKTAQAIILASSNGRASKHVRSGNQDRYGLFQIDMNSSFGQSMKVGYHLANPSGALDPLINARMAYGLSKHGTDWSAFDAYTSGNYKKFLSGKASASAGVNYVKSDTPINVHKGEAILDVDQAREWRQNQVLSQKSSGANVTINVHVAQASEQEAKRLADLVKHHLQEDKMISTAGRF